MSSPGFYGWASSHLKKIKAAAWLPAPPVLLQVEREKAGSAPRLRIHS